MKGLINRLNFKIISAVLALLLTAGALYMLFSVKQPFIPAFKILGDVENVLEIDSLDGYERHNVRRGDGSYFGVKLSDLVEAAQPVSDDYSVVIAGDDALIAEVDRLEGMYVTYTGSNAWEMINELHPPTSNIKRIREIWVVAGEGAANTVGIIRAGENIAAFTPGQFFMQENRTSAVFEGQSVLKQESGEFSVTAYTKRVYQELADIVPDAKRFLVMGKDGYGLDAGAGRIELAGNSLSYVFSNGKDRIDGLFGIIADPPAYSNMDAFQEAKNSLEAGKRTLVILVDGLGYHQYSYAKENGYAQFLSAYTEKMATSVYQPVTNAGLAAVLTGQPPNVNGVYTREYRELKVDDIFSAATQLGKTSKYIEGNINILKTSVDAVLNADRDGDGRTDREVFEASVEAVASGAELVFVHFHGVDDEGHSHGMINEYVMTKIAEVDGYVEMLAEGFNGKVIVTADHGMHDIGDGGKHGEFRYEDMFVPYISFTR